MEVHSEAIVASPGALKGQPEPGAMYAHPGAVRLTLELWRLTPALWRLTLEQSRLF